MNLFMYMLRTASAHNTAVVIRTRIREGVYRLFPNSDDCGHILARYINADRHWQSQAQTRVFSTSAIGYASSQDLIAAGLPVKYRKEAHIRQQRSKVS